LSKLFSRTGSSFFSPALKTRPRAADALVGVKAFEDEFRGGDLLLGAFFLGDAERAEFIDQSLNPSQILKSFDGGDGIGKLNLAAQVEPLHDLLHVGAGEIFVVSFGDGARISSRPTKSAPFISLRIRVRVCR